MGLSKEVGKKLITAITGSKGACGYDFLRGGNKKVSRHNDSDKNHATIKTSLEGGKQSNIF